MEFNKRNFSNEELVLLYKNLLLARFIEEKMLMLLRQGKISKWFSGIGQEAIAVGSTLALKENEWILPLHRNLGVFTSRGLPLHQLFMQWQGVTNSYTKGRERSFHFGSKQHHICGMISHLGPQLAVADGLALAGKLRKDQKISLVYSGEGGTSEGDFHEALNMAAVWDLPVIFLLENNGYALSTPTNEQYRCKNLTDKAKGYGMEGICIDGNNVLTVYDTIKGVREYCIKNQKPYLIECNTFRMRGHEESSGTKYIPRELFEEWGKKDPVKNYEQWLVSINILTDLQTAAIKEELKQYIEDEISLASQTIEIKVNTTEELADVYAQKANHESQILAETHMQPEKETVKAKGLQQEKRFMEAIKEGLHQSMLHHPSLILMGQDIATYGGAFKITAGLVEEFGKERVRNTPLCESAVVGIALGLSIEGFKSVVEMQFADFVTAGFNQIVNNIAKIHYRWSQNADIVIRMPTGAGVGGGPFHSQSNEAWFTHVPGLKVVYPSNPHDAKGLLIAAINDPGPVLYFEHKALYRSLSGIVPGESYEVEIGKAILVEKGNDISIITYGMGVHWALEYAHQHPHLSFDILDLRTLQPLDYQAIKTTVAKTGKILVLHEDTLFGGIGGEISAWINEYCFEKLDAPVMRCASLDTPVPFNKALEENFLAKARIDEYIGRLMNY